MVSSIAFSAFMALSLTPALCATLLKPVEAGHHHEKKGFFGWFNRGFSRTAKSYEGMVARILKRAARYLIIYVAIIGAVAVVYLRLPTSFLPNEDQGNLIVNVQLPPGATYERTLSVMEKVEGFMLKQPEVQSMVGVLGFSFSGQGQNAALAFVTLKDWHERDGEQHSASALAGRAFGALMGVRDAFIYPLSPPPIPELGTASGFSFRLQDRGGAGHQALVNARNQLLGMASKSPILAQVRPDGLEDAPQLQIDIDRDKANALGVTFDSINSVLSTSLGSSYVNDFPNQGRLQRVVVQADAPARMQPDDLLRLNASNSKGQPVPLSAFASTRWITGAMQTVRYNGYPAMRIGGSAAPGYSTGAAMAEMEKLAAQLPQGFGFEWTGQSREEKLAGSQATLLYGFAILAVFLCLAALYEHPAGGDPGRAAGRDRRIAGHLAAQLFERRVLPGWPDHHHRPVGEERDSDHRVRQGPAGAGPRRDRVRPRGGPPALPAHHHDLAGFRPGRGAAGDRFRSGLGEPARHRHRRDRRHDHRHGAGGDFCSRVLRGGARPLQRKRTSNEDVLRACQGGRHHRRGRK
jgi:multidrug efflux pump